MNVQEVLKLMPEAHCPIYLNHYKKFIQKHYGEDESLSSYREKHHIIPVSFGMRRDCKGQEWNLIKLKGRDHFIAHKLLWKAYGNTMAAAYFQMSKTRGYSINALEYEKLREDYCERMKKQFTGRKRKPFTEEHKSHLALAARNREHKSHSEDTKRKMREAWDLRREHEVSKETRDKISQAKRGQKLSEETKRRISESIKGKNHWTYGLSEEDFPMTGKKHSEETKKKMSEAQRGKPKGAHLKPCPYCGKMCQAGGSMKSHLDKHHQAEVGASLVSSDR